MLAIKAEVALDYVEDLTIQDRFGQENGFKRLVIQPNQLYKIQIDDFFRGHFLQYELSAIQGDTPENQAGQLLLGNNIFKYQEPLALKSYTKYHKTSSALSQFTAQCLYIFENNGFDDTLLFFNVDRNLRLIGYDLSGYINDGYQQTAQVNFTIFDPKVLSQLKQCSNLMQIDKLQLAAFCQSIKNSTTTMIVLEIKDLQRYQFSSIKYYDIQINYEDFQKGHVHQINKKSKSYPEPINFILLINMSSSFMRAFQYNYEQDKVIDFDKIDSIKLPDEFQFLYINDSYRNLKIQDIVTVEDDEDQYLRFHLVTDLLFGLFIIDFNCNSEAMACFPKARSIVNYKNLGELDLPSETINDYKRSVFVSIVQPPSIKEIIIEDTYNPYFGQEFSIQTDLEIYIGLNILDVGERYIIVAIMRLNDFQPILRVYDREDSQSSVGFIQQELRKSYFNDIFIQTLRYNHFFLRTSDYFAIYKIQSSQFIVNTLNLTLMNELNVYDIIIPLQLKVYNILKDNLEMTIEVIVLPYDSAETVSLQQAFIPGETLKSQRIVAYYDCGMFKDQIRYDSKGNLIHDSYQVQILDYMFSGPFDNMMINSSPNYPDAVYFDTRIPMISDSYQYPQDFSNCRQNQVVTFESSGEPYYKVLCISETGFKLATIDLFQDDLHQYDEIVAFELPDLKISAHVYDSLNSNILIFTDQNKLGLNHMTLHVLKLENQIDWIQVVKIGEIYEEVRDFIFSKIIPVKYNGQTQIGLIQSEQKNNQVQIYAFEIDLTGDEYQFYLLAQLKINLEPNHTILDMQISKNKRVWILCSNNTLIQYFLGKLIDESPTFYNSLKRVNQITFNSIGEDNKYADMTQFDFVDDFLVAFTGKNQLQVLTLQDGVNKIESQFTLMLSYESQQQARDTYEFIRDKNGRIQYDLHRTYFLIIFRDSTNDSVVFNLYNLNTYRHNTLYLRQTIIPKFDFQNDFIKMSHIDLSTGLVRLIILTANKSYLMNLEIQYSLRINSHNAVALDNRCKTQSNKFYLFYDLFPRTNEDQTVSIAVQVSNNGLLISTDRQNLNYTIFMLQNPIVFGDYRLDGQLNINEIFFGFNMWYNISKINEPGTPNYNPDIKNTKDVSDQLIIEKIVSRSDSTPLDFLSNSNQLLELFNIGQFIVMIDQNGFFFVTQEIKVDYYERQLSQNIIGCIPEQFTLFQDNLLIYQCQPDFHNNNQKIYGSTLVYTSLPNGEDPNGYYQFFEGQLYIKYSTNHWMIQTEIKEAAIFQISTLQYYVALVFDIPNQAFESKIIFNNISFDSSNITSYCESNENDIIYSMKFKLDQMRVTCLQTIKSLNILLIGVKDYGVLIYDIIQKIILQSINLRDVMDATQFQVKAIIQENPDNFYFVIDIYGVLLMKIYDHDLLKNPKIPNQGFYLQSFYSYVDNERFDGDLISQDSSGFAFLTTITSKMNSIHKVQVSKIMRYLSFNNADLSKMLATRNIPIGLECNKLRSFPVKYADTIFQFLLPHQNYVFYGLSCQTDLYFYLFSQTYSMFYAHNKDMSDGIESTHRYELVAYNDFDVEKAVINLKVIKNYLNIPQIFYYLFAFLGMIVMFALIQMLLHNKGLLKEQRKLFRPVKLSQSEDEFSGRPSNINPRSKGSWFFSGRNKSFQTLLKKEQQSGKTTAIN